ncbi:MAG: dihydroorotate dehydrogenase-like protein [Verrucomicrobiota bacterium]|nr:dihydroorotate dehydrogenase-like protein [Verrucomicrobiota bacterium]
MDLSTSYLGFKLPHPFIVGASPMIYKLDLVKRLEDAGAAAIVMHSLFEEQIQHHQSGIEKHILSHENSYAEATSYFPQAQAFHLGPDDYLAQVAKLKQTVNIPVIASLNGINEGTWVEWAKLIEQAGADALELNLYFLPRSDEEPAGVIEQRCYQIVRMIKQFVTIPVAVKLSPYFTSLPHFARRLETAGADALVLFNRFFQPDINIEELETVSHLELSNSSDLLLRLRWLAVLHGRMRLNLAVTGGVHTAQDAIKSVMAGADAVQMVSALLQRGPSYLTEIRKHFETWMEEHEYTSLEQMKGSMSYLHAPNPELLGRANYMRILQSWKV